MSLKPRTPQKEIQDTVQNRDLFRTPIYATKLLIPYIPLNILSIWECAAGDGHISTVLEKYGYMVTSTDINNKWACMNFLDAKTAMGDCIITNPPYSLKKKFFQKCIELDVPFALLLLSDYCQWNIDAVRKYGCEKIIPTKRIDYITPTYRTDTKSYFHSMWLTRYFDLGSTETFVDLIDKKEIE